MSHYAPILALTRGTTVESLHYGAATVVDSSGKLLAWIGDPQAVTFLRSTAKPFQLLPFIERGGVDQFGLTAREISQMCASHAGTDMHVDAVRGIQQKIGVDESHLQCGAHPSFDVETAERLIRMDEAPSPIRHNCSGKHTGMLAHAQMRHLPLGNYLDTQHPIQQDILSTFAEMCGVDVADIQLGTDGCSAPNFAIPLYNAALGFARLSDPRGLPENRAQSCQTITSAMMAHPEMVSGFGRFDTRLMQIGGRKFIAKMGAEGYQGIGILPDLTEAGSLGVGIALKIADGDGQNRACPAVALEILRQLGFLSEAQLAELSEFGPRKHILNWRKLTVGESYPVFELGKENG